MEQNSRPDDHEVDPLHESVGGTIGATGEYIQESTAIAESGYVDIPESVSEGAADSGDGPVIIGEDGGGIPESTSVDPSGGFAAAGAAAPKSNLKANMPFIVLGGVVATLAVAFGLKAVSGNGAPEVIAAPQQEVSKAPAQPEPVAAPIPEPVVEVASEAASAASDVAVTAEVASGASVASAPEVGASTATQAAVVAQAAPAAMQPAPAPAATLAPVNSEVKAAGGECVCNAVANKQAAATTTATATQTKQVKKRKPVAKSFRLSEAKPVKVKKPADQPPSTTGYELHMGVNGLAWVHLPNGNRVIAAVGDTIPGLGVVKSIDMEKHVVRVGRVTLR